MKFFWVIGILCLLLLSCIEVDGARGGIHVRPRKNRKPKAKRPVQQPTQYAHHQAPSYYQPQQNYRYDPTGHGAREFSYYY